MTNSTMIITIEIGDYEDIEDDDDDEEQSVFVPEYKQTAEMTQTSSGIFEVESVDITKWIASYGVQLFRIMVSDYKRKNDETP